MLLTKTVKVKVGNSVKHYRNKGYVVPPIIDKRGRDTFGNTIIEVKVEDLTYGSGIEVLVKCDCEDCKSPYLKPMKYQTYKACVHEDGKYYCNKCAKKLYSGENGRKTKLKNRDNSFKKWCYDNLDIDYANEILLRWDYDKNINKNGEVIKPSEVGFSSTGFNKKGYWFKCLKHPEHKSELKRISDFTSGKEGNIKCNQCNSFAQWGIDNLGDDFLEKYWDYEKNDKLGIDPWKIAKCANKPKVCIKCQDKKYHESYDVICGGFVNMNSRCPYCHGLKIHPLDSLCQYIIDNFGEDFLNFIWSDKNKKSAFEYMPKANQKVWWKCIDRKHEDYFRDISGSNISDFRCPNCQFSKGEKRIENWLKNNEFIDISDYEYESLNECEKNGKYYIPQKEFDGLAGLGNGLLSYDFYLPKYNILLEYQGEQHDHPVDFYGEGMKKAEQNFKKQVEHDKRKKQYAEDNGIELLPIWYWDYNNIENILNKTLLGGDLLQNAI